MIDSTNAMIDPVDPTAHEATVEARLDELPPETELEEHPIQVGRFYFGKRQELLDQVVHQRRQRRWMERLELPDAAKSAEEAERDAWRRLAKLEMMLGDECPEVQRLYREAVDVSLQQARAARRANGADTAP